MRYLSLVDVDDRLVDEVWESVSEAGGYYSIGDGIDKETFRKCLFESSLVFQAPNLLIRVEDKPQYVEVHPVAFGPSVFVNAGQALEDIREFSRKLFADKPLCCIIPDGMRGAKRLALAAGMQEMERTSRMLSGVKVSCTVFRR